MLGSDMRSIREVDEYNDPPMNDGDSTGLVLDEGVAAVRLGHGLGIMGSSVGGDGEYSNNGNQNAGHQHETDAPPRKNHGDCNCPSGAV